MSGDGGRIDLRTGSGSAEPDPADAQAFPGRGLSLTLFAGQDLDAGIAALAILSVAAALIYPMLQGDGLGRAAVKSVPMAALAIIALRLGAPLVAVALVLSSLGDWFLARPGRFIAGIAAFGAAHLVYIALFVTASDGLAMLTTPGRAAIAALLVVLAAGLGLRFVRNAGSMAPAIAGYIALLCLMGLAALSVSDVWIPAGAAAFIVSDSLIGAEEFGPESWRFPGQGLLIWASYVAAGWLLLIGLLTAG